MIHQFSGFMKITIFPSLVDTGTVGGVLRNTREQEKRAKLAEEREAKYRHDTIFMIEFSTSVSPRRACTGRYFINSINITRQK